MCSTSQTSIVHIPNSLTCGDSPRIILLNHLNKQQRKSQLKFSRWCWYWYSLNKVHSFFADNSWILSCLVMVALFAWKFGECDLSHSDLLYHSNQCSYLSLLSTKVFCAILLFFCNNFVCPLLHRYFPFIHVLHKFVGVTNGFIGRFKVSLSFLSLR